MILPSGVVYMVSRIGPSTDPCGTPYFSSDVLDPIWTVWVLSWRYDLNHFRASPLIPKEQSNKSKSFWWSMVSKAALRSKSTNMVPPSESTAWSMSFCTRSRAVSVLWSCLYADWNISYKPFSLRWSTNCTQMICSISLETKDKLETGR